MRNSLKSLSYKKLNFEKNTNILGDSLQQVLKRMTHVHEAAARNRPRTGGYLTKRTEYMSIVQEETKENVVLLNKDL